MVRTRRMALWGCGLVLALGLFSATARADTAEDIALQQERQKQIQADTDHMVRRVATMLRVLEYYQLDQNAERKLLHEVAVTLSGLSRKQMNDVLARLDAAAKTPDANTADEELQTGYA